MPDGLRYLEGSGVFQNADSNETALDPSLLAGEGFCIGDISAGESASIRFCAEVDDGEALKDVGTVLNWVQFQVGSKIQEAYMEIEYSYTLRIILLVLISALILLCVGIIMRSALYL